MPMIIPTAGTVVFISARFNFLSIVVLPAASNPNINIFVDFVWGKILPMITKLVISVKQLVEN